VSEWILSSRWISQCDWLWTSKGLTCMPVLKQRVRPNCYTVTLVDYESVNDIINTLCFIKYWQSRCVSNKASRFRPQTPGHMAAHWHNFSGTIRMYSQAEWPSGEQEPVWTGCRGTNLFSTPSTKRPRFKPANVLNWENGSQVLIQISVQINSNILSQHLLPVNLHTEMTCTPVS